MRIVNSGRLSVDHRYKRPIWLALCLVSTALDLSSTISLSFAQEKPVLQVLTKGVYAFIGVKGNANAGFILTEQGVIVVDSQMNEELAQQMLTEIRRLTPQPVLYVVNTHHHGDHTFANHIYLPTQGIIAHENAFRFLQEHGEEHLRQFAQLYGKEQSKGIKVTLPTLTLQDHLTLTYKKRKIEILYLGKGHTEDDLVVYLPEDKILFSGDLVYVGRLPWLGDGNTKSWLRTIEKLKTLEFESVVPGHGKVGNRKDLLRFERYLTDLRVAVITSMLQGLSLEEMKQTIQIPEYQQDLKYADWLPLHVEKVYREMQEEK